MTTEQFRAALRATPFRPFRLRMSCGQPGCQHATCGVVYDVDNPELAIASTRHDVAIAVNHCTAVIILDLRQAIRLEYLAPYSPTQSV